MTDSNYGLDLSAQDLFDRLDFDATIEAYQDFDPIQQARLATLMKQGHFFLSSVLHILGPQSCLLKPLEEPDPPSTGRTCPVS